VRIDSNMPQDTIVAQRVDAWMKQATDALRSTGFESSAIIGNIPFLLDGSESAIRNSSNSLTNLICVAFAATDTTAEAVIFNGGSIRIDDKLPAGPITQYDVLRILPFGGNTVTVTIQGDVLQQIIKQGEANKGTGGFLHYKNISKKGQSWFIGENPIDNNKVYRIVTSDFLITGKEKGLEYFSTEKNPKVTFISTNIDVRKALIQCISTIYNN
jgi:5'-nucleotidase